jgi:hypothetical protein
MTFGPPTFTPPTRLPDPTTTTPTLPTGAADFQFLERYDSRPRKITTEDTEDVRRFVVLTRSTTNPYGVEDDVLVDNYIDYAMPKISRNLGLTQAQRQHVGGGVWEIEATYNTPRRHTARVRVTTGGKTIRVVQGYGTVYSVQLNAAFDPDAIGSPPTAPGPSFGGLVGVTADGVEGVEVPGPGQEFTVEVDFLTMTQSYINLCDWLSGCVNSSAYLGRAAGELLFHGMECSYEIGAGGTIILLSSTASFKFEVSPNMTNIPVGPFVIPSKRGWDYLWPRTVDVVSNNTVIKHVKSVHIDQVLRYANLSLLGI